jgi:nucleoside-diphosphate-sugar epimerase
MPKNLLITGATGQQGGSTIKALLASPQASDFTILAVTRNAASASAKKLEEQGVKIVQGDLNDVPGIFKEAEKVAGGKIWGVFSVQVGVFWGANIDFRRFYSATFLISVRLMRNTDSGWQRL